MKKKQQNIGNYGVMPPVIIKQYCFYFFIFKDITFSILPLSIVHMY